MDEEREGTESKPPVEMRRFISVTTDAIMDEYKAFQNSNLSLGERVRAAIRLLSTAYAELKKYKRDELAQKVNAFLRAFEPPRWRSTVLKTTGDVTVYRLFIGGPTESTIDVTLQDFQPALKFIENQMFEESYKRFARVVGYVMMTLADLKVIDEKPPTLAFSFSHLTSPLEDALKEEEQDASEQEKEVDDA